jgi:hypothetical protein
MSLYPPGHIWELSKPFLAFLLHTLVIIMESFYTPRYITFTKAFLQYSVRIQLSICCKDVDHEGLYLQCRLLTNVL